jgi:hypothetical protein
MSVTSVLKPSNSKQELPITSPGKRKRIESALRLKTIRAAQTEAQSGSSSAVASTSKHTVVYKATSGSRLCDYNWLVERCDLALDALARGRRAVLRA